jgi:hypothetical protein
MSSQNQFNQDLNAELEKMNDEPGERKHKNKN